MFHCNIETADNYFRHGLFLMIKKILASCKNKSKKITLTDSQNEKTNIVFIDADADFFHQKLEGISKSKNKEALIIIVILNSNKSFLLSEFIDNTVSGIIYKTDAYIELSQKINKIFNSISQGDKLYIPSSEWPIYPYFDSNPFSLEESIVLELFKKGFSEDQISLVLCKDEKTVNRHKISAMNKLGEKNIVELFRQIGR